MLLQNRATFCCDGNYGLTRVQVALLCNTQFCLAMTHGAHPAVQKAGRPACRKIADTI